MGMRVGNVGPILSQVGPMWEKYGQKWDNFPIWDKYGTSVGIYGNTPRPGHLCNDRASGCDACF